MIMYAGDVDGNLEILFVFSNIFGDVWDVFRHHHWCPGPYLGPSSTNIKKTQIFFPERWGMI